MRRSANIPVLIALAVILPVLAGMAQDRQFSQFYASQAALNPAFAGNTIQGRLSSNYRKQWPGVSGGFTTFMMAYDHNLHRYNSGLGLVITRDRAGSGGLSATSIAGQYAYHLQLSRSLRLRAGLQLGYGYNSLDRSRFVFTDQLLQGTASSVEDFRFDQQSYLNVASGLVLYSRKVWLGFSGYNLNTPDQTFTGLESNLPVRLSVHGGGRFPLDSGPRGDGKRSVSLAFHYKNQGGFDQFDAGGYYAHLPVFFGVWYRGLPVQGNNSLSNADALVLLTGVQLNSLRIGYSYDITVSALSGNSAGSHEVSLVVEFFSNDRKMKRKRSSNLIPCAIF